MHGKSFAITNLPPRIKDELPLPISLPATLIIWQCSSSNLFSSLLASEIATIMVRGRRTLTSRRISGGSPSMWKNQIKQKGPSTNSFQLDSPWHATNKSNHSNTFHSRLSAAMSTFDIFDV